ncbi:MAG TPA: class I SAM-dependent methyltransferase [Allosphingosinicella sp.]|nr:class I SAM-dependent methyltransferase [Allosphingosinicella sp.]
MTAETARRSAPRLRDTDWLMLRGLAAALEVQLKRLTRGARLLDFGCGSMPYRLLVEQQGAVYVGADFGAGAAVEIGRDGSLPVPDASIDAVLSVQVLEHVRDLDLYLGEAGRVLKPDGTLFLSTHGTWLYHPHPEDHRRWTRTGLVADIEARGFRVEEIEAIVGPLATTTLIRLAGYAHFLRRVPVLGRFLAGSLAVLMNLRALLEDRMTPAQLRRDNGCIYVTRCVKAPA